MIYKYEYESREMSTDGSIVMIMTVMVWYLQKFCSPYFIDFSDFVSYAYENLGI